MGKPKIRFKGYVEDWEQRKVTELGEVYIGLVTTMTAHYTNEGTLLIRNSDIKDGKFEFDTEPIYLDKEFAEQNKSRMHKVGDVITVHTGDVGTSVVITENEANSIGFATIVTRPNQKLLDSYYLSTFLNTEKHKAWAVQMSTGDGRTNYNLRDYTELVVPVPKLEEQKKIASYISSLNNLITLHQRKCEETKILKKYMLQKMFPQNGKKVPEIRFSGYTEDWEQRKFADMAIRESAVQTASQEIPSVEYDDVVVEEGCLNKDISSKEMKKSGILFDGSQVLYGKLRPYLHNWLNPDFKGVAVGDWWVLKPIDLNKNFLYRLIQTQQFDNIANQSAGSKMPRADWNLISNSAFMVPFSNEEQRKIGDYFLSLDHLITLHQHKCEELRKIKKYMLQNMFV